MNPDGAAGLEQRVALRLRALADARSVCVIAVSGGPDSMALLELLHRSAATHGCALVVGHVDHGIATDSAVVAGRVARAAAARGVPCQVRTLALGPAATETQARRARRAALREIAETVGGRSIALAHHAEDQAETVLMRVLHGTGPAGLAGMAARRGRWLRPLLQIGRVELVGYLRFRGIDAWNDPANTDPRHFRSWLRQAVVPTVQRRLPDLVPRLVGVARQAASARAAWGEVLTALPELELRRDRRGISVAAPALRGYGSALRHAVLAALGRQAGVLLGSRRMAAVHSLLESQSASACIDLAKGHRAELAFGRLAFFRVEGPGTETTLLPGEAASVGRARFAIAIAEGARPVRDGWSTVLMPGSYAARPWRAGDRIRPLGGHGSRAVAVLFREARIAAAARGEWPVVVRLDDATIVWVPGICRSDAAVPGDGTEAWHVQCALA